MSIGSMLLGIAVALVTLAYLARPFRVAQGRIDADRAIEVWVAQTQVVRRPALTEQSAAAPTGDAEAVNFCSRCGRRVGPDDVFCPGCGKRLRGGGA
ncbi:MAG: zinc ribbon domain-containing protein [Anaerolineae bacterium]|nr:zinc ribbon domain-containing protein [Anaerolineae bacterium]